MAPVKIKHVVSFSSQDPKHPVENLLCEELARPWLCCPRERSGKLKVELQLERASHVGFIDVGNCGSALVQIDVGRSSWPLNKPYVTLLPATALMTPADAKLGRNRTGVRMFKEGDFLLPAVNEKWDRIQVNLSQPFNKYALFGLSFIRICTPLDENGTKATAVATFPTQTPLTPTRASSEKGEPPASPWLANPAIQRTFFPETLRNQPREQTQGKLQQVDAGCNPRCGNQAGLSRTARMVISAAESRRRALFSQPGTSLPALRERKSENLDHGEGTSNQGNHCSLKGVICDVTGTKHERANEGRKRKQKLTGAVGGRSSVSRQSQLGCSTGIKRWRRSNPARKQGPFGVQKEDPEAKSDEDGPVNVCPLCGGLFSASYLPLHASTCGDVGEPSGDVILRNTAFVTAEPETLSSSPEYSAALIPCPLCGFHFGSDEIERHASACGELEDSMESDSNWLWV
ncbi:short transient receptor potential channel 2 [Latimeria chalumnae]|uniref:short transient receptor potential channel 2 n=1 Tax=Latimeria chalumnae TaxID=7897 RepID=UPI00313D182E